MLSEPTIRRMNAERRAEDEWFAEMQKAEIAAEQAIERYYEGGWDLSGQYSYDPWDRGL